MKPGQRARVGILLVLLAGALAGHATAAEPASADAALAALEARLLAAERVVLRYRVSARGAFEAELAGDLLLLPSDAQLRAGGTFGGAPVDLWLYAGAGRMQGGSTQRSFDEPTPGALRAALVLGLTRMGILHNLARLSAGSAPDHAAGGVEDWVQIIEPEWLALDEPAERRLGFGVEVAGQRAGEAELWLSAEGLPLRRRQVVRFPGGEMHVLEEYQAIELLDAGPADDS